jgi:hypothetical protein
MIRGSPRLLSIAPWADFSSRRAPLAEITWNKQRRFAIKFPIAARHGPGAAAVAGRIYDVSGGPTPGDSVSAANEIFVP